MVSSGAVLNVGTAGGAVIGGMSIAVGGYPALGIALPGVALVAALLARWSSSGQASNHATR